jgi:hypothetical protein
MSHMIPTAFGGYALQNFYFQSVMIYENRNKTKVAKMIQYASVFVFIFRCCYLNY